MGELLFVLVRDISLQLLTSSLHDDRFKCVRVSVFVCESVQKTPFLDVTLVYSFVWSPGGVC